MAAPTVVSASTIDHGSPEDDGPIIAFEENDIVLFIAGMGRILMDSYTSIAMSGGGDFSLLVTEFLDITQDDMRVDIWWWRADRTDTDTITTDHPLSAGTGACSRTVLVVRGAQSSGSPFEADIDTFEELNRDTDITCDPITTTVADSLVFNVMYVQEDLGFDPVGNPTISSITNSDLTSYTTDVNSATGTGRDRALAVAHGTAPSPATVGSTTATCATNASEITVTFAVLAGILSRFWVGSVH